MTSAGQWLSAYRRTGTDYGKRGDDVPVLIICNFIAAFFGFIHNTVLMYGIFGIIWTVFSYKYKDATWKVYEILLTDEEEAVIVDLKLVNIVVLVFCMACIYVLFLCLLLQLILVDLCVF